MFAYQPVCLPFRHGTIWTVTVHTTLFQPISVLPRCQNLVSQWKDPKSSPVMHTALPLQDKTFSGVCLSAASVSASGGAKDLSPVSYSRLICICPCSCLAWAHNNKRGASRLIRALRHGHDGSLHLYRIWSDLVGLLMLFNLDMCQAALWLTINCYYYCGRKLLLSAVLCLSCVWCLTTVWTVVLWVANKDFFFSYQTGIWIAFWLQPLA